MGVLGIIVGDVHCCLRESYGMQLDMDRLRKANESKPCILATWLCCIIITLITLLPVVRAQGDDTNFARWISESSSPAHWVWERYLNWSGRVFSESAAAVFIPLDQMWWRVANALMVALLIYSMIRLVSRRVTVVDVLIGYASFWLIAPGMMLNSVYWVAGSFAYLWPTALAFFASLLLVRIYRGESVRHWGWYIPVAFVASLGVEQVGLCLCAFALLTLGAYWIRNKKISIPSLVFALVSGAGIIIEMVSPGSHLRTISETKNWYPEFATMPLSSKIVRGIMWQFSYTANFMLLIIAVLIIGLLVVMAQCWCSTEVEISANSTAKGDHSVPLFNRIAIGLAGALLTVLACEDLIQIRPFLMNFSGDRLHKITSASFWTILLVCLIITVLYCAKSRMLIAFILLAGIAASAVMYFSPTIYASGPRTMFISALLFITVLHFMRSWYPSRFWYWIIGIPAAANFLHFVYAVWSNYSLSLFG